MPTREELDAAKQQAVSDLRREFLFGLRLSAKYHSRRRDFLDALHSWSLFVALVSGPATVVLFSPIGDGLPMWVKLLPAMVVTVVSAADQAFAFMRKAWLHNNLSSEYVLLERDLLQSGNPTSETQLNGFKKTRIGIESREPPMMRALEDMCHNEMVIAQGLEGEFVEVSFWKRLLAHFVKFD